MKNTIYPGVDGSVRPPLNEASASLASVTSIPAGIYSQQSESYQAAHLVRQQIAFRSLLGRSTVDTRAAETVSEHEAFMQRLLDSGVSLAEVLKAWHDYYAALPTTDRIKVWQDFRSINIAARSIRSTRYPWGRAAAYQTLEESNPSVLGSHRLRSLRFGIVCSIVAVFIFMFSFFNEVIIAPFIQPSRGVTNTPVLAASSGVAVSSDPQILIPKINIEIPVDYSLQTTEEQKVETALEGGIVHYPTTALPGQIGNAAFFGHSSNNILNPGKYKFAFVLLKKLVVHDVFYLAYNGHSYGYEVISSQVVKPSEVGVLGPVPGQTATATLITCDPPGTSINRLVVVGKQINPSADTNTNVPVPAASQVSTTANTELPSDGPTLWQRIWTSIF